MQGLRVGALRLDSSPSHWTPCSKIPLAHFPRTSPTFQLRPSKATQHQHRSEHAPTRPAEFWGCLEVGHSVIGAWLCPLPRLHLSVA